MSNAIDLTTLIPRCHEASKANGWWEPRPNAGQQLMLVVSELSEALEADRNGRKADFATYNNRIGELLGAGKGYSDFQPVLFKDYIKDSVGDELADAYIRLCDFAGGFDYSMAHWETEFPYYRRDAAKVIAEHNNFGEGLLLTTRAILNAYGEMNGHDDKVEVKGKLLVAMCRIEAIALQRGIDLATHIDLKLAFNATRGQKHGGKAY